MIKSIFFDLKSLKRQCALDFQANANVIQINLTPVEQGKKVDELSFVIKLSKKIIAYRSHKYTWEEFKGSEEYLHSHSSKIIVLEGGIHLVSATNIGVWVIKNSTTIRWVLKSKFLTPVLQYNDDGSRNFERRFELEPYHLEIIRTKQEVPEFSRSKIPFSAIMCFTDHCDFDTNDKLSKQLHFFKVNHLKVSKGFFLNHFSKRSDNSSYERDFDIFRQFKEDGHELFYHALTQSSRNFDESLKEFIHFSPPPSLNVQGYVDHGYQIYNTTKRTSTGLSDQEWSNIMASKGIRYLWNYNDTGVSCEGVINQLDPRQFSINRLLQFKKKDFKFILRANLLYGSNEKIYLAYKIISLRIKRMIYRKQFKNFITFFIQLIRIGFFLTRSLLFNRAKIFNFAKYSPFIFEHKIGEHDFYFFQTLEVINFEETFNNKNVDLLIDESGAFIAHCYFSSTVKHQHGRLFLDDEISLQNWQNFNYIRSKIDSGKIWNPVFSELLDHHIEIMKLKYTWDEENRKIIHSNTNVPIRYIKYV